RSSCGKRSCGARLAKMRWRKRSATTSFRGLGHWADWECPNPHQGELGPDEVPGGRRQERRGVCCRRGRRLRARHAARALGRGSRERRSRASVGPFRLRRRLNHDLSSTFLLEISLVGVQRQAAVVSLPSEKTLSEEGKNPMLVGAELGEDGIEV